MYNTTPPTPVLDRTNWNRIVAVFTIGTEATPRRRLHEELSTIRTYEALTPEDQIRLLALLAHYMEEEAKTVQSMKRYAREILNTLKLLDPSKQPELAAIFCDFGFYTSAGVLNLNEGSRNLRVSALKAFMKAAVGTRMIDQSHVNHLEIRKTQPHPRPATEPEVLHALRKVLSRIDAAVGFYRVLALRDLAMLEWKSYGIRSCEMEWATRGDFESDPKRPRIRKSKSRYGERILLFAIETIAATESYLKALDDYREAKGLPSLGKDDPLWIGIRGQGLSSGAISGRVSELLPAGVRPHDLRSRAATWLAKDHPLVDIAAALGITAETTSFYVAVADPSGVMDDLANKSALATFKGELGPQYDAVMNTDPESRQAHLPYGSQALGAEGPNDACEPPGASAAAKAVVEALRNAVGPSDDTNRLFVEIMTAIAKEIMKP